uniref:ubiquitinyl hydrolase 1 n=1 Tax=Moniliophthora roreri TaxID=221103 RepID=A0A0W0FLB1_MONRR
MAQKRKRRASSPSTGLPTGEVLKRDRLAGSATSWGWVGTEVRDPSEITQEHILAVYGLSSRTRRRRCPNKYAQEEKCSSSVESAQKAVNGELDEDVIVISDDEELNCNKKDCKQNPFCLNYLGQEKWEDEGQDNPLDVPLSLTRGKREGEEDVAQMPRFWAQSYGGFERNRDAGRVEGATCYANASLQVWFRDITFREGVYSCQPIGGSEEKFMESPIFQLQVTFAALQESIQKAFNPTKLVESLQLRAAEQQDAQEFSKLFMSHLDEEFKKQPNPRLKSLITDHFEGTQVYCTVCRECNYKSERSSNFLELEINFQNKARLEDCIQSLLEPEHLTGDNQWVSSPQMQPQLTKAQLRELPPVLHFSLLRFVYDLKTMERKKSKNIITFPTRINMQDFLGQANRSEGGSNDPLHEEIYELRGILLHKGPSAYHGHYEAQVYDGKGALFQFNDDIVTRIDNLGDAKNAKGTSEKSTTAKRTNQASKKRRIQDSDEEIIEGLSTPTESSESDDTCLISSKDAYMLIYVKKSFETSTSQKSRLDPPPRAFDVIKDLNKAHNDACVAYEQKQAESIQAFEQLRQQVMDVYRHWEAGDDEDMILVGREALEKWLANESMSEIAQEPDKCDHGYLDFRKTRELKCLKGTSYEKLKQARGSFILSFPLDDLCEQCIEDEFYERLYQVEHPRQVSQFNELLQRGNEATGYWISKAWLKDWTLQTPKMHQPSHLTDAPPDSHVFESVRCEHGGLSLNQANRRRISVEACELLTSIFPEWKPISVDEEPCSICEALLYERRNSNLERRKRAEEEKAKLKRMYEYTCDGNSFFFENVPCAIIAASFLRHWRRWLGKPTENERPEKVDNSLFFCEHGMLSLDPDCPADLNHEVSIIRLSEWDVLETLYPAGPLIALEHSTDQERKFICSVPVCQDCRYRRKVDWHITDLTIRTGGGRDFSTKNIPAYANTRQSSRLRQVKEHGGRVQVTKATTVKQIKIKLQEMLNIPTICQRLFYQGKELDDGAATVGSIGLFANDILDLQEQIEVHELSDDDDGFGIPRDEGRAFGGTLLGSASTVVPAEVKESMSDEKSCSACTFINPSAAVVCTMCGSTFV